MAAHAGEVARKTSDLQCVECDQMIHVEKGDVIPECACGGESFEERQSQSSKPGTRRQGEQEQEEE